MVTFDLLDDRPLPLEREEPLRLDPAVEAALELLLDAVAAGVARRAVRVEDFDDLAPPRDDLLPPPAELALDFDAVEPPLERIEEPPFERLLPARDVVDRVDLD